MEGEERNRPDSLQVDPSNWEEYQETVDENTVFSDEKRPRKEKAVAGAILIVALVAVFFVYYQLSLAVTSPFNSFMQATSIASSSFVATDNNGSNSAIKDQFLSMAELKSKDTDGDGLSDYDELYKYHTSQFLEDTDGDGIFDGQEIKDGTDPRCPTGQMCDHSLEVALAPPTFDTSVMSLPDQTAVPDASTTLNIIKQLLLDNGVPPDQIYQFSDADLLVMYQQVGSEQTSLSSVQQVTSGNSGVSQIQYSNNVDFKTLGINSLEDFKKMSGSQLRQLMIYQGVATDTLNQITDDEIKTIFLEQLQSVTSSTATSTLK
ncbi:MAG: hypothetical protein WCP18_00050 [bacterium]